MALRDELNEYDLGLPMPLAPVDERRRAVPPLVWELLNEAKTRVAAVLGDRLCEMRLFGSYARGQFDDESDIDVLVVPESLAPNERGKIVDAVCSVSTAELIVNPIILTRAQIEESRRREVLLVADLDREGIPL